MKALLSVVILFLSVLGVIAQDLPSYLTPQEKQALPAYLRAASSPSSISAIVSPPSSPVRTIAEWEELQGLLVTWTSYQSVLKEIVREAKKECKVYIVTSNINGTMVYLANSGIDTSNIEFVTTNFNSVWSRDYGPWSAYTNDVDTLLTIDWIYNRPRPFDDQVPVAIASIVGTPLYETTTAPWDLVHTGGNFMTDGMGTGFSSKLILNENPGKSEAVIDTIMKKFMGIDRYIKMNTLPYDGIHHIDMHMKLLDEETILMGQYPLGISDGPQIEANLQYVLSNFNSPFGTPYKVIRIPMPPDQTNRYPSNGGDYWTHTNSSFINKTIIVPTYGGSTDTTALRIYREALPGYTVTGINARSMISALGALHCITKEIGTTDPLLILHQSLENTYNDVNPYTVTAEIKHRSGILNADLYYRTDTVQPYSVVSMINSANNSWSAMIPAQTVGTTIHYYIDAEANNGKTQVRPIVAPDGYFDFKILQLTALEEFTFEKSFAIGDVFPNPASAITCIPVQFKGNAEFELTLHDISGRLVEVLHRGNVIDGDRKFFMDASQLQSGVYLLKYQFGSAVDVARLIVQ